MQQFIPESLDIDFILKEHPPQSIKRFNCNHLIYILHLITSIPATNKKLNVFQGYTPLYSKILQNKIKNYRQYLDYLLDRKILCTNNRYIKGTTSKGYKFTEIYSGKVKPITINDRSLKAAIRRECQLSASIQKKYKHLFKWYKGLKIDHKLATDYINQDIIRKLKNLELRDFDAKTNEYKNPYNQFNAAQLNIERIAAGEFMLSVDDNVFRLHSAISNLKSEIRNCITYEGERLVSIDIKNSQPYLSTVILNPIFWVKGDEKKTENHELLNIYSISRYLLNNIFPNSKNLYSYIMLSRSAITQADSDLQRYQTLVSQGKFYEYLQAEISKELNIIYYDRKKVKASVFQVLFTDNRFLGQEEAKPKRIFKTLFPNVYELFSKIKRTDKTNLPTLLQRIESHLMLLIVTKRIAKEKPDLPIFTIHDSVVTTVGNEAYVKDVVTDELHRAIGVPPQLSLEEWKTENLKFNDGTTFFKTQDVAA